MSRSRILSTQTLKWLVVALLVAGFLSFVVKGADEPADPVLRAAERQPVEGFGEIAYRVNRTAQSTRCAILAQTAMQQSRGLSGRSELAGYDGMLFVLPADVSTPIPTRNVGLAVTTAFFDAGGRFMSSTDNESCPDRVDCPTASPPGPYRYAIQVPRGGLGALGIEAGSVLSVGGPCP